MLLLGCQRSMLSVRDSSEACHYIRLIIIMWEKWSRGDFQLILEQARYELLLLKCWETMHHGSWLHLGLELNINKWCKFCKGAGLKSIKTRWFFQQWFHNISTSFYFFQYIWTLEYPLTSWIPFTLRHLYCIESAFSCADIGEGQILCEANLLLTILIRLTASDTS